MDRLSRIANGSKTHLDLAWNGANDHEYFVPFPTERPSNAVKSHADPVFNPPPSLSLRYRSFILLPQTLSEQITRYFSAIVDYPDETLGEPLSSVPEYTALFTFKDSSTSQVLDWLEGVA